MNRHGFPGKRSLNGRVRGKNRSYSRANKATLPYLLTGSAVPSSFPTKHSFYAFALVSSASSAFVI